MPVGTFTQKLSFAKKRRGHTFACKDILGHWDVQNCFPMFVHVFQAVRGVKNDLDQNVSFFPDIHKVNEAPNGEAGCDP